MTYIVAARFLARVAIVFMLALAALLLGADASEYPGLSRAGVRVLARDYLPLVLVAALNLYALDVRPRWRVVALTCNLVLLVTALRRWQAGSPLFVPLFIAGAALLVVGMAGVLHAEARQRAARADVEAQR